MSKEESVAAWHDWTPNHHHAPYDVFYYETNKEAAEAEAAETGNELGEIDSIPLTVQKNVQKQILNDTEWLDNEVAGVWEEQGVL